ncbi:glycosyltransferase [Tautonia marina]|uniref:glycosyltransferase n=1 Tax=Tautonia marina TaxID=2653855 RepID=UPI001260FE57|nr:glycosyltransferase [Tautonia marina]
MTLTVNRNTLPARQTEACDGVVWCGNVDYWYHNRGHSSVRMAVRLARRGVPTLWINSIGMRMPVPGRTEIAWSRYTRKLGSMLRGLRRDPETGMWVYSPLFVPKYSPKGIELNGRLLAWQIAALRRWLGMKHASAVVSMPTMGPAVERLNWTRTVFERCDDFGSMPGADHATIAPLERRLVTGSDVVIYVNEGLMEAERGLSAHAELIGHGVDFERFAQERPEGRPPEGPPPEPLRGLPRPIIGFYGGMDDYRMDRELLVRIARHAAARGGSLVLIGPAQMDLGSILAEPNVRHIGQMPPNDLPAFAAHFDVGIIPFLRNEFNESCNPIKIKEYLAIGFPVVASELPAFDPYDGLIEQVTTHDEFLQAIDHALLDDTPERTRARRATVAEDSWDRVTDRIASLLGCPPSPEGADATATP